MALELRGRYKFSSIIVLEKEPRPGMHASVRNSGVLHSGIYYPENSLKSRICKQGAQEMADYHHERGIPLLRCGKVLVASDPTGAQQIDVLASRASTNGIQFEVIDNQRLRELEPEAKSVGGRAIWVPSTSVGSPLEVMKQLLLDLERANIRVMTCTWAPAVNPDKSCLTLQNGETIAYGHVINAAGLHADTVAKQFDAGSDYTMMPFKGAYWRLDPACGIQPKRLIYPVPDLRMPFLGVHTTTAVSGETYIGPTAAPALGRENYTGLQGASLQESAAFLKLLAAQFIQDRNGFRRLAWTESGRYFKLGFAASAKKILPRLKSSHLQPCNKVGLRAQLLNNKSGELVTDFVIEKRENSTHILNAISPAWTCAFPFARLVCDDYIN